MSWSGVGCNGMVQRGLVLTPSSAARKAIIKVSGIEPSTAGRAGAARVPLWGLPRRLGRFALVIGMVVGVLVALGAVLPVPSTLMLWRFGTGESVTRAWVRLDQISPELVRAVIASEDQNYCRHWGVDLGVLREVLSDEDGPSRGGSTIAMQTVKNVYLWHGRSYVRKALELPLAVVVDAAWSKRRVMEVYLNVAEFGEGLFGKPALRLNRREAAALAASLPNPRLRNPAVSSSRARTNGFRIQNRMAGLGDLAACVVGGV